MMKIKATTPCYKFIDATPDEQQEKLLEEVLKVTNAWKVLNREYSYETLKSLLMELLDVKVCVNTAIAQLELYVEKENLKQSGTTKKNSVLCAKTAERQRGSLKA